jgi:glucose-6-phosphate isomerase
MPQTPDLSSLVNDLTASRIWKRETEPFARAAGATAETHAAIRNRLGWLDAPTGMRAEVGALQAFAAGLQRDGLTDVFLLGMGGSSLCAEVLRDVGGSRSSGFSLTVLDTTDERAIQRVTASLDPARACFLVASKSGSTVEVTSLERHFNGVLTRAGISAPGRHFAAITDPDTSLVAHAAEAGYRHTFINPADIGGRYSALSLFGLLPAVLCGVAPMTLLDSAISMADQCKRDDAQNPGLALGAFMGSHARSGRDKLTTLIGASAAPLGVWIEQLVAESTGKHGRGVLPVVDEPIGEGSEYGPDRLFVAVLTPDAQTERDAAARLSAAGHPVFTIETTVEALGGEFFRWEFATAVAGIVLEVNPFDEPDVRGAKVRTQRQLDRAARGEVGLEPPLTPVRPGVSSRKHQSSMSGSDMSRYIAILDYMPADPSRTEAVKPMRAALRQRTGRPSTYGVGPRYLHSTGQYHKGGPNTGMFVIVTGADATATEVPNSGYTFSTLKLAQAHGDFDALVDAGRTVVHYHVDDPQADWTAVLEQIMRELR